MLSPRKLAAAAALAVVVLGTADAGADRLLTPLAPGRARARTALRGVGRVQPLRLDAAALADLRGRRSATLTGFPLGRDRTVELLLTRFEPFAPGARAEVVEAGGARRLALPDQVYFRGAVRGEPDTRVLVIAARQAVHGLVVADGTVYPFGPDASGNHRSYALRDADPAAYPPPGDFCANDLHPRLNETPGARARTLVESGLLPPPVAPVPTILKQADVAIETDREFRLKFASDQAALDYLASLAAAANAIYERDVAVRLQFSYIRLWGASPADPWTGTDTIDALDEVQAYWLNPSNNMDTIAGSHDTVHFISGKSVQGGVAYLSAICDHTYGFGVSQVFGSFDLSDPTSVWDLIVVTHELGHNFGSPHTHCYSPPVDRCYATEPGCYSGSVVNTRGTIMSYCHLLGGVQNIDLVFGNVVSAQIVSTVDANSCLATIQTGDCGNSVLEAGEQCDDGNNVGGDGCSSLCRLESCGDKVLDVGEQCDDGNASAGDGCSPLCELEPRCGDGSVDAGEECDDGNEQSADGCSMACQVEPCTILKSAQTVWPTARVILRRPGTARDRLTMRGDFGLPMPVGGLSPATSGARLILESVAGARRLDVTLPPGPAWSSRRGGWTYNDRAGTAAGIRKLVVRDHTAGGVPDVQVTLSGQGGGYKVTPEDLPLAVTLVLGDEAAGRVGACGRFAFGGAACSAQRRGSRIICR